MNIIFMGTPDFAVPVLERLLEDGHQVTLAVTQPDKPKGRGKNISVPPVKACATAHNIPVFQPVKIREEQCIAKLKQYAADIIVVVAFGQILTKDILEYPKYGCINVHASLLPKYRGAAPIQHVILTGENKTGVTIMQMDEGLDTGDMLATAEVLIENDETGGSLHDKLSQAGAALCARALREIEAGTIQPVPQNDEDSSYAGRLNKQLGNIDWQKSAIEIERLVRGLNPWPSAYTHDRGKLLKIWKAAVLSKENAKDAPAGSIIVAKKDQIVVQTGQGQLKLLELQPEGKKRMAADAFLRGYSLEVGDVLS